MVIDAKQLDGPSRRIGTMKGEPIMESRTKGGWHIISRHGMPIGAGPHRAVARVIAKKRSPDIVYDDLAKGNWVDPVSIAWLLPKWEGITDQLVSAYEQLKG
jgi:hypothetical protein